MAVTAVFTVLVAVTMITCGLACVRLDPLEDLEAVHARHQDVEQHDVDGRSADQLDQRASPS